MKLRCLILSIVASLAACGPPMPPTVPVQHPDQAPASFLLVSGEARPDDIGRFLAGMPVRHGATLSRFQQTGEYQEHHREMRELWRSASIRLNIMRMWSGVELAPLIGRGSVLYPFGGPDLLYANALFPAAKNYVLMGLEPVGDVPALETMPSGKVSAALAAFRKAVQEEGDIGAKGGVGQLERPPWARRAEPHAASDRDDGHTGCACTQRVWGLGVPARRGCGY